MPTGQGNTQKARLALIMATELKSNGDIQWTRYQKRVGIVFVVRLDNWAILGHAFNMQRTCIEHEDMRGADRPDEAVGSYSVGSARGVIPSLEGALGRLLNGKGIGNA